MAGAAGSWEAKVLEMEGQLADAQKERDDFCAMVVDLETKLLASTAAKADDQRTKLEQRVWDLENSNAALGQSLSALEEQCSDYRQESERQRQKETSLTDEHLRLCEEHAELTRQLEECKLAQERVAEDATAALAAKDVDLGQLQVELGNAMTEGEARLEALIAAQARNEQLRQDLDNLHGALGVQTERAVKAESELATAQSRSLQLEEQIRDLCAENKGCRREIDAAYAEAAKANAVARKRELELTNEKDEALELVVQMRTQVERTRVELDEMSAERLVQQIGSSTALMAQEKTLSGKNLPSARTIEEDLDAMTQKWEAAQRELNAMRERLAAVEEEHNEAMQKCRAAEEEAHVYRQAAGVPRHCTSAAVPRTPSHANALLTPVQAPNSESRQQNSEAPNSESRWQNLKNIQSGDKWFKVPDLAAFSESTRKAQQALLAAEEELQKSAQRQELRKSAQRQPWTPPSLPRAHLPNNSGVSGKKDVLQKNLGSLLEEAAADSKPMAKLENVPPSVP